MQVERYERDPTSPTRWSWPAGRRASIARKGNLAARLGVARRLDAERTREAEDGAHHAQTGATTTETKFDLWREVQRSGWGG